MKIIDIARVAHEANKTYCETIGDMSQKHWEDAPEWQRESAIKGVRFLMENPDAKESASHDSWLQEKEENGWIYGETKDEVKKTHPCFVPYEELPLKQKAKDYLFNAIGKSMLMFVRYEDYEK